jgi:Flp pilus assembly pilin Flp
LAFVLQEEAQDLVEFAFVVALVAFGATVSLKSLGTELNHVFTNISSTLATAS